MMDGCTFQGGLMTGGMFLFWGLLVFLGFYLMKSYMSGKSHPNRFTPIEILKVRFAKGEISEDEYERLKMKL